MMTYKKRSQLEYTQQALVQLKERLGLDGAEAEWARNAMKLDTLTYDQLRAVEWLANKIER